MKERVQAIIAEKKFRSVEWYTNYFEWLNRMKEEYEFKKFQLMLKNLIDNHYIKEKDKVECLMFFYPAFEQRLKEVVNMCKLKEKKFNFTCKPIINIIWEA